MKRQRDHSFQARNGFFGCRFCGGRGCLACDAESIKQFRAAFPDQPVLTIAVYSDKADRTGQADMVTDGCPQVAEPYVIHPDDTERLLRTLEGMER